MTVTTRRERRQQQRRQQQRRSGGAGGGGSRGLSQLWIALGVVVLLVAVILVGRASGVFDAPVTSKADVPAVDVSGPKIGTHQEPIGKEHIPTGQKAKYTQGLPPTSGEHYAAPGGPVPWGVKTSFIQFESTTHNLEHGGIVILHNGLDKTQADQLASLVRNLGASGYNKIVLEPWPDMPADSKVVLTAWNWILKLPALDETSVVKFVKQHTDDEAPENGTP